jgi:hypothetical protein
VRLIHDVEDGRRPQSIETLDELLKAPELAASASRSTVRGGVLDLRD